MGFWAEVTRYWTDASRKYRNEMMLVGKRDMVLSLCNEMSSSMGMFRIWVVLSWRDRRTGFGAEMTGYQTWVSRRD